MMELVIYKPQEHDFLQSIDFNYEELNTQLAEALVKYEGLVYSDSNIRAAKSDRANLNKFKDALETRRKEIKKACLTPYEEFETKVKDLVAMVDKPILAIDTQVKAYEQILKDEKLDGIKQVYADRVGDLADLVPFDKIFNPRWLNTTYKGSEIEKEIINLFARVESDLKVIGELDSPHENQIKRVYLTKLDLTAALQEKTRIEEEEAKLAEYKRIEDERKAAAQAKAREEKKKARPEPPKPESTEGSEPEVEKTVTPDLDKILYSDLRVYGTREQLTALQKFLVDNGIKYGAVPRPA